LSLERRWCRTRYSERIREALGIGEEMEELLKGLPVEAEVVAVELVDDGILITFLVKSGGA
jgi:hypothetical protein